MTNNEKDLSDKSVSMNREIKFKSIIRNNKDWTIYNYYYEPFSSLDNNKLLWYNETILAWALQYINCKDINWVEIYDGDIVKRDDESNWKYRRFAVVKINPDIQFDCKDIWPVNWIKNSSDNLFRYGNFSYKDTHNHLEIIWNIYQNPELLSDI